jgi:hypothetical protein
MMDRETFIEPLQALKLGFATHVLVENGRALVPESIKHLTDAEIDQRDLTKDYDDLASVPFDPMNADADKVRALQQRQAQQSSLSALLEGRPGPGGRGPLGEGFPLRRLGGSHGESGDQERLIVPQGYEISWSKPGKLNIKA